MKTKNSDKEKELKNEINDLKKELLNARNLNKYFTKQWKDEKEKLKNCKEKLLEKQNQKIYSTNPELKKWKDAFWKMRDYNRNMATELRETKEKLEKEGLKHIDSTMTTEQIAEESIIEDDTESIFPESKWSQLGIEEEKFEESFMIICQMEENYQNLLLSFNAKVDEYEAAADINFRNKIGYFLTLNNKLTFDNGNKICFSFFKFDNLFLN